jgi:hypothetical protein
MVQSMAIINIVDDIILPIATSHTNDYIARA